MFPMSSISHSDLLTQLNRINSKPICQGSEYLEWINSELVDMVYEFIKKNKLNNSKFIRILNNGYNTKKFDILLKRWLSDYLLKLFGIFKEFQKQIILEDNSLNRFAVEKYQYRFKTELDVKWKKRPNSLQKIINIVFSCLRISYLALNRGIRIQRNIRIFKVMREATWGLYGIGGYYFHDDFLVDNKRIKAKDIILYSRGIPKEKGRLKGYCDAKRSSYAHFNLSKIPIRADIFFNRIIPKYIILGHFALLREFHSGFFSLYLSIYIYFIYNALPFEKVFSNFKIISELGHNYFSAGHIPEAIVCQCYGVKYYLMHWSDNSIVIDKHLLSFLGCDGFLIWGNAHLRGEEGSQNIILPTGYVFKRFIKQIASNRDRVLQYMNIERRRKIISFFDESFGEDCKMTAEHYVTFWKTALKLAETDPFSSILIKPKGLDTHGLPDVLNEILFETQKKMKNLPNLYIVNHEKWSFIEVIGVSDIVITQGMTSSATIAIICGIEGLYLDQAQCNHPFSRLFKNMIVFDDADRLLSMVKDIVKGTKTPLKEIPEDILRAYDAYSDDRGVDLFRKILSGAENEI